MSRLLKTTYDYAKVNLESNAKTDSRDREQIANSLETSIEIYDALHTLADKYKYDFRTLWNYGFPGNTEDDKKLEKEFSQLVLKNIKHTEKSYGYEYADDDNIFWGITGLPISEIKKCAYEL